MSILHVRHSGTSRDIFFEDLFTPTNLSAVGLNEGVLSTAMSPQNIKEITANYLDVPITDFDHYEVDFHKNTNITLRPEAEFGS